ncbi:unnamed protein product [Diamesa serratosioi]
MAKFALLFVAALCIVQIALCAETREKRDEAAAAGPTTQNILDMIKNGLESTFSEDNLKKAVDNINDIGDKLKDLGTKTFDNVQKAFKKDETATEAPTA